MSTSKLAAGGLADAERLRGIANTTDLHTRAVLADLPAPETTRAADLGAGTGSVARWMAEHWPQGRVLAVDQDTTPMAAEPMPPNCDILRADLRDLAPRIGEFDLVHARFVLSHLPERDEVTAMAAGLLEPGGWLVVTEPYALATSGGLYPAVDEVMAAYNAYCARSGMGLHWAKTVPGLASRLGLTVIAVQTAAGRLGGGPGTDRWAPLIARVRDELVAAGLSTDTLEEFTALCAQPQVYDVPQVMMTTVAAKPSV